MRFRIGDRVYCKIRGNSIVTNTSDDFETLLNFEIIGKDNAKYLLYIPLYYRIKNSWTIKEEHIEKFSINPDYLDFIGIGVTEDKVSRVQIKTTNEDGMFCGNCNEFFPMSEPNQSDGSLRCYQCRSDPWR